MGKTGKKSLPKLNDKQKKKDLASRVHIAVNSDEEWQSHLQSGKDKINLHLNETSFAGKEQKIDVDFLPYDFNKLVENLKIQMLLQKVDERKCIFLRFPEYL